MSATARTVRGRMPAVAEPAPALRFDLNKYKIQSVPEGGGPATVLSAIDIAQEAVQLESAMQDVGRREREFSSHMVGLAMQCATADEFNALCENVSITMNWGKQNPAPRRWVVYRSTIYRAWADHGVQPGVEIAAPVMKGGKIIHDEDGDPVIDRVTPTGINQIKKVAQAIRKQDAGENAERRSPARVAVEQLSSEALDKDASIAFQKLLWAYSHSAATYQKRIIARVNKLVKEFQPKEAFPENSTQH